MRCVPLLAALLVTGCLIPPPLEAEGSDGGPNHPPQILWDIISPPTGPLTRPQTAPGATKKVTVSFVIGVYDPDPQTLHLNIFLYGVKDLYTKPIRSEQAAPTSTGKRAFLIDLDSDVLHELSKSFRDLSDGPLNILFEFFCVQGITSPAP